ncbi:hypothetical protein B0A80_16940 [Flavobacterium tructae]|uniref:NACHT domain-containing protein n=1 Tax=Flavobacterium tructae TaxID=1114873 RepID=UPI000B5B6507|nr:hypothetical protein [Flavobacterium tructae]OXB21482.1 hypothetical protein B0A80_16940 [Flavobacterium tructae]
MSEEIITIPRDAGNTSKGYTLQKLRTIALILDELEKGIEGDFVAAIEFGGDVYVAGDQFSYVEENKDYDSKNFSFASSAIKNTMVYFLDYWLNNKRDLKIKFGVFATNKIAKEKKRGIVKDLCINLPTKKIIESLHNKDYSDPLTLSSVKILVLDEYKRQYESNKSVSLEKSHYKALQKFKDEDWTVFLDSIQWTFSDTTLESLEKEILEKIAATTLVKQEHLILKAPYIRAELFYQLELRQTKTISQERFLDREKVEQIFYKAIHGQINDGSYKYLNIDYSQIQNKTKDYLKELIDRKYFAISGIRKSPGLLRREVLLLDGNVKTDRAAPEDFNSLKDHGVKGDFSTLVNSNKPVFLFGELGTGKSSIAAQYMLDVLEDQSEIVPLFIPSNYLQQKSGATLADLKIAINNYVNKELQVEDDVFDLDTLFKTRKETILILDGIDELELKTARLLIGLLKSLKSENDFLRVIATGRPVELEGIVPLGWHTLGIVPLQESDILKVLYSEAVNRGLLEEASEEDSKRRYAFLKSRPELYAISTTPLIICSLRDSLDESLTDKTLGDILFDTLKKKLSWNSDDSKSDEYTEFADSYPTSFSKEPILANLAWKILSSKSKAMVEDELENVISLSIAESANKPKITAQAVKFFKNNFLEKSTGETYAFISAPMLECAAGIYIAEKLKSDKPASDIAVQWRSVSFALAIARKKGIESEIEEKVAALLKANLTWPRNFVVQGAILSAEFKSKKICEQYFDMLDSLQYRPIRIEFNNDIVSINGYASCMILAGEKGFGWFWDNYLDMRNPLMHYESKLAAEILSQYMVLQNFKIKDSEKKQLESLIVLNLAFPSSFCYELLPVIAMVTANGLTSDERYRLLAGSLSNAVLGGRAKEILLEESTRSTKSKEDVCAALETICSRQLDEEAKPAELWFEISSARKISTGIIGVMLKSINAENYNEYKKRLASFINEDDLKAFLKYCILSKNEYSASAALFLFLDGEKDFKLIGESLLKSIDWLDSKNYSIVQKIEHLVKVQDITDVVDIIHQVPFDNHLGIPPAFWRIFLSALQISETDYEWQFMKAVRHMSLHTLTRYPEIRLAFAKLLNEKRQYQNALQRAILGLDTKLRYLSASLLLVVNPMEEFDSLEAVIYGIRNHSDKDEWETFCLGLHYGPEILDKLHDNLSVFRGVAKIFALLLLKRNDKQLSVQEMDELIKGLLLEGYFLDKQGWGINLRYNTVLSRSEYLDVLLSYMDDKNITLAHRAADILYQHHLSQVDDSKKPKIYMLHCEKYERSFFEFTIDSEVDLTSDRIIGQMREDARDFKEKHGKDPVLWLYCQALNSSGSSTEVLEMLIGNEKLSFNDEWDDTYAWLVNVVRRFPFLKKDIATAIKALFEIPAILEADADNFGWLKLMENEFDSSSDIEPNRLDELLPNRAEELFIALYARKVYKIDLNGVVPNRPSYYRIFAENRSKYIEEVSVAELEKFLFSAEQIPLELGHKMLNILLFGNFSDEELNEMEKKGELGCYFATVIKFCRGKKVDTALFSKSSAIGGVQISQRDLMKFHKDILYYIYRILCSREESQRDFIAGLETQLRSEDDPNYADHFEQLLGCGHTFEKEQIIRLFDLIDEQPYLLKASLLSKLSHYFANRLHPKDTAFYVENFKKFLRSNRGYFSKYDMDSQRNVFSWVLSLGVLFLEEKVSEEAKFGFLLGLQSCFLEKNSLESHLIYKPDYHFEAGTLIKITGFLLERINPTLIAEICDYGSQSNIPEVRATCHVLTALAGRTIE